MPKETALSAFVPFSATVSDFLDRGQQRSIFKATRCSGSLRDRSPLLDDPEPPT